MAVHQTTRATRTARLLTRTLLSSPVLIPFAMAQQAQAQSRVVGACTGASLPASAVTDLISPIITGITGPTESTVNGILGLPLIGGLLGPLNLNATGLLNQAASGAPITLQVLATDGTIVGPTDACQVTADGFTLDTPAGVAIGGNQITGLGANGATAFASDINAVAFGNNARAEAGAVGSVAIGAGSNVTAANSVALGAGSTATRGALANYTAVGLTGTQTSAGEVSIGTAGAPRQLTNVAAGSAASDAATVGQVAGVAAQVTALGDAAVQYDTATRDRVTLAGVAGTTIGNVAPGVVAAGSTEAVNGAQLFATNQAVDANGVAITDLGTRVTANTGAITALDTRVTTSAGAITDLDTRVTTNTGAITDLGTQVTTNTGAITDLDTRVTTNTGAITDLDTRVTSNTTLLSDLDATAIRYDAADRATVTFGGAGGTVLANVAPGAIGATSTQAVNGAQLFATNQAVGALDARVTTNTDAITDLGNRVNNTTNIVSALDAAAVRYDGPDRGTLTLSGATGTVIANVTPGLLSATSSQAVNGSQLFATNAQVAANTAAIASLGSGTGALRYSDAGTPTVPNGGTVTDDTTLIGASGGAVGLHNVRDGVVATGSTDAVNGGQLAATNQAVAANTGAIGAIDARVTVNEAQIADLSTGVTNNATAITNLQNSVAGTSTTITNLSTQVSSNTTAITNLETAVANQPLRYADAATPTTPNGGAVSDDATLTGASGGPVGLRNVRGGALVAGSTDAVNGDQLAATNTQLAATNTQVAANTTAINNFANLVTGSTVSPVQYSNAATPTVPNGGTLSNDVTLVGADPAAAVALHNVAGGAVTATSTDAVNGQQLFAVASQASNSVQYDRDAAGNRTNTITLAGQTAAPVTLANVAGGTVAAGSTQAVNGGQLYATAQVAQQAAALGANSVQYDSGNTSVTFNNAGNPVVLRNVAAGTSATDGVNVGQLQSGLQGAVAQANGYTDARLAATLDSMNFNLRDMRRDIGAGTSSALAAAALPQANEPGRSMVAIGGGTYRGQTALAFGASTFLDDGHSIFRLGATIDSRGKGGANAGYGYQF